MVVSDSVTEEEFDKALGQLRLQALNTLMAPLRKYGQGDYVDGVIDQIISLAVQLHLRLSGVDEPYIFDDLHW